MADADKKMTNKVIKKVGIIGTGKHGSRYAGHLVNDLDGLFQLAAISRRSPEGREQARNWNAALFSDWRDLITSPLVDAVISVTTPDLNPAIASLCAAEKKPLLLEKPLTTDFYSARKIVELFDGLSIPLTIGQTLRYNSIILALKEKVAEMGRIYSFFASQRLEPSTLGWLEVPEIAGAGVIYHTAVHLFDALRFITGQEVKRIRATTKNIHNRELEDLLIAEVELADGSLGIIDASKVSPSRACRYEFICEKGQLQGDQVHGLLQQIVGMDISELAVQPPGPTILPLLREWHGYLTGEGANPIPGAEGLAAVKICHACRKSALTGEWQVVADI